MDAYLRNTTTTLEDHAAHLLFSANRWEAMQTMRYFLEEGFTLVVDRYAYSGVAYTAAKGYDIEWCKSADVGLLQPDLVIYLDITVNDAMKRGNFGGERYETETFQEKVREIYINEIIEPEWKVKKKKWRSYLLCHRLSMPLKENYASGFWLLLWSLKSSKNRQTCNLSVLYGNRCKTQTC